MPVSKAQQRAVNKYVKANYDRIEFKTPKGRKGTIQAHARARGESVNGFISRAIAETMERDASFAVPAQVSQQALEASRDGGLVLMKLSLVSKGRGSTRMVYTDPGTGRNYYVEPVISDEEWETLQKAKNAGEKAPDELSTGSAADEKQEED